MKTPILPGEAWWGGIVQQGPHMPLTADSRFSVNFTDRRTPNQITPILLSSRGRCLSRERAFCAEFADGCIETPDDVHLTSSGTTLRDAYLAARIPFRGVPDERFFRAPQYNTWIELGVDQTEQGILRYAEGIVDNGFPPGILMIDEGWAEDYGRFTFRAGAFSDARAMVDRLHGMGFSVMVWMTPYLSPDSPAAREAEKADILLRDRDGEVACRAWWNGRSAVLDLTNPAARDWFSHRLRGVMDQYGVDGFKFDGGDGYMYRDDDRSFSGACAWEQARAYIEFGSAYPLSEFRAGWRAGGVPCAMRLADKLHTWENGGIDMLIPCMILSGLIGCAYACPDMIGGGEINSLYPGAKDIDRELIVRYAQASALCPMMQFSVAPWRVLDGEERDYVRASARLHEKMGDRIWRLAAAAAEDGEPILRPLAYNAPGEGLEGVTDEFMLGRDLLVAPVLTRGARGRFVALPRGQWTDDEGKEWDGGRRIWVDADLSRLPYFTRQEEQNGRQV